VAEGKGVRVAKCPIERQYCYTSCYWRKGNRCYYRSKRGRQIPELKKKKGCSYGLSEGETAKDATVNP